MEGIGDDKIAVFEIVKPLFHLEIFDGVGQIQLFLIGRELIVPAIQHIDELPIQFFGYMKKCLSFFQCRIQNVSSNIGFFFVETAVVSQITENMKIASAYALAGLVSDEELCADYILPKAFDPRVKDAVAKAAAEAAIKDGVARI